MPAMEMAPPSDQRPNLPFDRAAFVAGIRDILPIAVPAIPFGLVLGLAIGDSGLATFAAWSSSWLIFAGASQLAAIELLAQQAGAAVVMVTVGFINSRHLMYSAALRSRMAGFPTWFRVVGPYFLIDQSFAVANAQPDGIDDRTRMWHYFGTAALLWTVWQTSVATGIAMGDLIRPEWQLPFAVPLLFGGLMILSITNRAGVAAAVVGASVALLAAELPQGSGVLLAIVAGVTAGAVVEGRSEVER
jgi:predicted branched-subunit amino acid permease